MKKVEMNLNGSSLSIETGHVARQSAGSVIVTHGETSVLVAVNAAKEMREELRSHISLFYGPSAWKEIVEIEARMRRERKAAVYAAEERKQKILEWIIGLTLAVGMTLIIGFIIWIIGLGQGRW